MKLQELKLKATEIRRDIIKMINAAGSGHTAGSLGMADVFASVFYSANINPHKPNDTKRDYIVLSNGHICPGLYATMAHRGFFSKKLLLNLRKFGSKLQGHPHRGALPGIETSSGPLGEGLSQACGMAIGLKMDKKKNYVYCLTSDGEHQEGNTWEAVMLAAKYKLSNLIQIMDRNFIQIDGTTEEVMPLISLKDKYEAFGWYALEIDGNDVEQVLGAIDDAKHLEGPVVIIANTIPGKGVSFMEKDHNWHGKAPNDEEMQKALHELK